MKMCSRCKVEKPFDAFHRNSKRTDGLQSECKICKNLRYRGHYATDKDRYRKNAVAAKARLRDFIRSHKEKPCADCGIQYEYYVMQFDHLSNKEFTIGRGSVSYGKLEKEIAKCEIVCANCHARRTWSRSQAPIV